MASKSKEDIFIELRQELSGLPCDPGEKVGYNTGSYGDQKIMKFLWYEGDQAIVLTIEGEELRWPRDKMFSVPKLMAMFLLHVSKLVVIL